MDLQPSKPRLAAITARRPDFAPAVQTEPKPARDVWLAQQREFADLKDVAAEIRSGAIVLPGEGLPVRHGILPDPRSAAKATSHSGLLGGVALVAGGVGLLNLLGAAFLNGAPQGAGILGGVALAAALGFGAAAASCAQASAPQYPDSGKIRLSAGQGGLSSQLYYDAEVAEGRAVYPPHSQIRQLEA